jgi:hypothetical protein
MFYTGFQNSTILILQPDMQASKEIIMLNSACSNEISGLEEQLEVVDNHIVERGRKLDAVIKQSVQGGSFSDSSNTSWEENDPSLKCLKKERQRIIERSAPSKQCILW